MLPVISSGPKQRTWVSMNEWLGHTDNNAATGVSASSLGWVSGHQDTGLAKVSSLCCVFVPSLPSLPHQVIHFSSASHMTFEFGLCCAWFILCLITTKKKKIFPFASKVKCHSKSCFLFSLPVFILCLQNRFWKISCHYGQDPVGQAASRRGAHGYEDPVWNYSAGCFC